VSTRLRKITAGDAALLVRWRNENAACFAGQAHVTRPGHDAWFRQVYQADPWDHMYMILHAGRPAGTIGARITGRTAEIQRVLLGDKTLARTGVMSAALEQVMNAYGPRIWELRVLPGNRAAIAFYGKHGFEKTGRDGECLVMTR
jgi:RimJ/RimL family protein N-acetyltransferase